MDALMTTNIYEPAGVVLIAGTCLPRVEKEAYEALAGQADFVYSLCLEQSHINMAVTKLGAMASTGRITKMIFATVDRSPHCTQLHYIDHEIRRMMTLPFETEHYVACQGRLYPIADEVIEQSKTLRTLSQAMTADE
ncbi:MAG: hypothetical protein ACI3W5_00935 [Faecousia sp.]